MLQVKVLRELSLAAGLWLTATAAMAGPQPGQDMPLGKSALPPEGYVEFCERKPKNCGADATLVLADVRRAQAERAELMAQLGAAMPPVLMPAALGKMDPARPSSSKTAREPEFILALTVESASRAPLRTSPEFIDPAAELHRAPEARAPRMTPSLWSLLNRVNGQINTAIEQRPDLVTYGVEDYWNTPLEDGGHLGDCEDYVLEKERALLEAGIPRQALNIAVVRTRWGESHAVLLVATSDGEYVLDSLTSSVTPWRQAPYRWLRRQVSGEALNWVMVGNPFQPNSPATPHLLLASNR